MGKFTRDMSEDCLTLSISTPTLSRARLPVVVWIHGGANVTGAGSLDWYNGAELSVRGNVVVVNLNFRLGVFGYLYYPKVTEKNLMIKDILCALKWVQKHIGNFGGDPDSVTVMGQSAGGNSIVYLLTMPEARTLFHKVILESASIGRATLCEAEAADIAKKIFEILGIQQEAPNEIRTSLLSKTPDQLLDAVQYYLSNEATPEQRGMLFKPVDDTFCNVDRLIEAAVAGCTEQGISVLIGTNANEMLAFNQDHAPEKLKADREKLDRLFVAPSFRLADGVSMGGGAVWAYYFSWSAPGSAFGSCHCIELPFVFGNYEAWKNAPMLCGIDFSEFQQLHLEIQTAWLAFIAGQPLDARLDWPKYSAASPLVKEFDGKGNAVFRR